MALRAGAHSLGLLRGHPCGLGSEVGFEERSELRTDAVQAWKGSLRRLGFVFLVLGCYCVLFGSVPRGRQLQLLINHQGRDPQRARVGGSEYQQDLLSASLLANTGYVPTATYKLYPYQDRPKAPCFKSLATQKHSVLRLLVVTST